MLTWLLVKQLISFWKILMRPGVWIQRPSSHTLELFMVFRGCRSSVWKLPSFAVKQPLFVLLRDIKTRFVYGNEFKIRDTNKKQTSFTHHSAPGHHLHGDIAATITTIVSWKNSSVVALEIHVKPFTPQFFTKTMKQHRQSLKLC